MRSQIRVLPDPPFDYMKDNIVINNSEYKFVVSIPHPIPIVDSFVQSTQKLGIGSGEHKLYFGGKNNKLIIDFFGGRGFIANSFVSKENLINHLKDLKDEYLNPSKKYNPGVKNPKLTLKNQFTPRLRILESLNEFHSFNLFHKINIEGSRQYATGAIEKEDWDNFSEDEIYKAARTRYQLGYAPIFLIPIPEFSTLDIDKYENLDTKEEIFLFKLYVTKTTPNSLITETSNAENTSKPNSDGRKSYEKRFHPSAKRWRSGAARSLTDKVSKAEIYQTIFSVDNKTYVYVGQDSHCSGEESYFGSSLVIFHYEEIYGKDIFNKKILKKVNNISQKDLNLIERDFIKKAEILCKKKGWFNINYTGKNQ